MEIDKLNRLSTSKFLELYSLSYIINKDSEVYGKEILDSIRQYNLAWNPSHGSFYPIISSMLKDGLITYAYEYDAKKYYNITDVGKEYYKQRVDIFKEVLNKTASFYTNIADTLPEKEKV